MKALHCCLLLSIFFFGCNHKRYHVINQPLLNNTIYGWGNIFYGGTIKVSNLTDTAFEFELRPYDDSYNNSNFRFPTFKAYFISDSVAKIFEFPGEKIYQFQMTLHILHDGSLTIEQKGKTYILPWRGNDHIFLKGHIPYDDLPSLDLFSYKLNQKLKRKMNHGIVDFIDCLREYKVKYFRDSIFAFKMYSGINVVLSDTNTAILLVRNDSIFTAGITKGGIASAYSNDPVYGGPGGQICTMFRNWFSERGCKNINYTFYNPLADSL